MQKEVGWGKQNKNNESLNTTQDSGIGAVFTLVGARKT